MHYRRGFYNASVLLLRVWHGELNSPDDMVYLSAEAAEEGAARLQIPYQNFHPTFSHIFP
jgi:hypothetical protein